MKDVFKIQEKLVSVISATGFEAKRAEYIKEMVTPYVDDVRIDPMNNVIAHRRGNGKRVMLAAHMDTVGFIVTDIDKDGFLDFNMLGGHFATELINLTVIFPNGTLGVIRPKKMEQFKDREMLGKLKLEDLYIDIGTTGKEQTEELIQIGDYCIFSAKPRMSPGNLMVTPYCDDLAGCTALILAMQEEKTSDADVYYVFTVQEEIGTRGATTAAYSIDPDICIAIDVTAADDMPEAKVKVNISLGKGPTIKIKEARFVANQLVLDLLYAAAEQEDIPYQKEISFFGGTDAMAVQMTRGGVFTGCVSIPSRYMHSPIEMVNINDVELSAKLLSTTINLVK